MNLAWAPEPRTEPVEWLTESAAFFGKPWWLTSLYPFVARILHPARRGAQRVTWAEVAAERGVAVDADTEFWNLVGHRDDPEYEIDGLYDERPWVGLIPEDVLTPLLEGLDATPDWGLIWPETRSVGDYVKEGAAVELEQSVPYRLVRRTSVPTHPELTCRAPNSWWPDNRSWCVHTDIDSDWTLVGVESAMVLERLLMDNRLEVLVRATSPGSSSS